MEEQFLQEISIPKHISQEANNLFKAKKENPKDFLFEQEKLAATDDIEQTIFLMHYMTTRINTDIELLDLLKERERTGETQAMRSFLLFWNQYPVSSQDVVNEWIGFKTHHERQESRKTFDKTG